MDSPTMIRGKEKKIIEIRQTLTTNKTSHSFRTSDIIKEKNKFTISQEEKKSKFFKASVRLPMGVTCDRGGLHSFSMGTE